MHTLLALTVVTTGVGYLMVRVGLGKGMLQPRRASRRCPSCSRLIDGSVCRVCSGKDR